MGLGKPPKLIIESPTNATTYDGKVTLNFTVEAPNNWFNNQSENWNDFNLKSTAIEQKLKSVTYILDDDLNTISIDSNLCLPYKGSIELTNLIEGTHQLTVYTNATGVYRSFRGFFAQTQINDSNKTVIDFNFVPAPTPSPLTKRNSPHLELTDFLLLVGVIVSIIAVLTVLTLRRHRKISSFSQETLTSLCQET